MDQLPYQPIVTILAISIIKPYTPNSMGNYDHWEKIFLSKRYMNLKDEEEESDISSDQQIIVGEKEPKKVIHTHKKLLGSRWLDGVNSI
jgi:hypothetical protein